MVVLEMYLDVVLTILSELVIIAKIKVVLKGKAAFRTLQTDKHVKISLKDQMEQNS